MASSLPEQAQRIQNLLTLLALNYQPQLPPDAREGFAQEIGHIKWLTETLEEESEKLLEDEGNQEEIIGQLTEKLEAAKAEAAKPRISVNVRRISKDEEERRVRQAAEEMYQKQCPRCHVCKQHRKEYPGKARKDCKGRCRVCMACTKERGLGRYDKSEKRKRPGTRKTRVTVEITEDGGPEID